MATFSPHAFLTSQGWAGTGAGLRKDSIKKPVTVAHKTNLKGIGKERDTGYAWWDDVFSMVAGKKKGGDAPEARKTSTGIHSPLPPGSLTATSSAPTSGTATPIASTSASTGVFHSDIIGQAKLEAARREFYAKFLRGRPLVGTVSEKDESEAGESAEDTAGISQDGSKAANKAARRAEKEERRRLRQLKRDLKQKRATLLQDDAITSGPSTAVPVEVAGVVAQPRTDEQDDDLQLSQEEQKAAERAARKLERKKRKAGSTPGTEARGACEVSDATVGQSKRKRKAQIEDSDDGQNDTPVASTDSGETAEERQARKAAKRARKEDKARRKQEKGQ